MATIDEVAALAGVSAATVSRVINQVPGVRQKTRDQVHAALEKLAYTPNRAAQVLARSKESTLGLIVATLSEPFFMSVADSIGKACRSNSMPVITLLGGQSAETEEAALRSAQEHNCRSIVFHSKYLPNEQLTILMDIIPGLVLLNRFLPSHPERCIWLDNTFGAQRMIQYLIQAGHRSFAYINSCFHIDDPIDRLNGWRAGLQAAGLTPHFLQGEEDNPTALGGYKATSRLLEKGIRFTCLLAYDDSMAAGAIRAFREKGIEVPKNVSVIGFNDSYMARFAIPKLTTMHYPVEQMAQRAAGLAIEFIQNSGTPGESSGRFVPIVVERQSVALISDRERQLTCPVKL